MRELQTGPVRSGNGTCQSVNRRPRSPSPCSMQPAHWDFLTIGAAPSDDWRDVFLVPGRWLAEQVQGSRNGSVGGRARGFLYGERLVMRVRTSAHFQWKLSMTVSLLGKEPPGSSAAGVACCLHHVAPLSGPGMDA